MRETATATTTAGRRVLSALQGDLDRLDARIEALEAKSRRAKKLTDLGHRRTVERQIALEARQLSDQMKSIGEMQAALKRRQV